MINRTTLRTFLWFLILVLFVTATFLLAEIQNDNKKAQDFHEQSLLDLSADVELAEQRRAPRGWFFNWPQSEQEEEITMLFTGDIMLGRYIAVLKERKGGDFPFTYMPEVIDAVEAGLGTHEIDLVLGNVEGPISTSNYVNPGTAMRFNFKPEVADQLAEAGFTTVTMANNHSLDQGEERFKESKLFLTNAGINAFGHADRHDGDWSFTTEKFSNKIIGFLGLNHTVQDKLDWPVVYERIKELDKQVDFLVIAIHWGTEYAPMANEQITQWAHNMVDSGADFIWGHHPHVIQNREVYKGAPIYYSLGNFVFDQYWSQKTQEGLVVGLKLKGDEVVTTEVIVDLVNQGEPKPRE